MSSPHAWPSCVIMPHVQNKLIEKPRALLSVDLEDYRRQQLRDHLGTLPPAHPDEVRRQLEMLLKLFEACQARATFFTVGRLASELPTSVWTAITATHRLGCHGDEHARVDRQGPARFLEDTQRAKAALEQAARHPVIAYRAPYFSSDGCDPWFGETLAACGFRLDSSRRLGVVPAGFQGTLPLPGAAGRVVEVPLPSLGFGPKRLTVIGGTYFRLLPLATIQGLLARAAQQGFLPLIYLHPYDIDPSAAPLEYPRALRHVVHQAGDTMRRMGRRTAGDKLRALARRYTFHPLESVLPP